MSTYINIYIHYDGSVSILECGHTILNAGCGSAGVGDVNSSLVSSNRIRPKAKQIRVCFGLVHSQEAIVALTKPEYINPGR